MFIAASRPQGIKNKLISPPQSHDIRLYFLLLKKSVDKVGRTVGRQNEGQALFVPSFRTIFKSLNDGGEQNCLKL